MSSKFKDIRSYEISDLEEFLINNNEKKFRAKQLFEWIQKGVENFDDMTNISKELRLKLKEKFILNNAKSLKVLSSENDGTKKYLFKLNDGNIIESVLMRYKHGNTVCVSTQIGCKMGCTFCASTIGGMVRNLTAGEIIGQIFAIQNDIKERVSNIVLMGSGEPLDNYDEVIKFLRLVNHPKGLNIGMRSITLSTSGIAPKIKKLADLNLQLTLAISLHAPNDDLRSSTMPINNKYPIKELIEACKYYIDTTGRRVTFEYALIENVNDNDLTAQELGKLLKGMLCHVNLIPINAVKERGFKPTQNKNIVNFKKTLEKYGITVTIRRELGSDINAACGQLRKGFIEELNIENI
ncbi:dual-specificity RNA methyltransferase RlmN [Helicovermis profundi]|uniref:Probable dual-specificity RNA methyltransferase RlmN n=1 Tax=Helicovermis profundi TaxID=3065157 RepID=A0AAU9ENR8_9FIRM|nr:23S rRNA (adenine(2503)-C(2))-methyltransferase RlmN [Clostridia bacterium S502]